MEELNQKEQKNADIKDIMSMFIQEHYSQIRHFETQRSTISNLTAILAAAILAFITYDKTLTNSDLPLTILLIFIGLFGVIFCLKYYERANRNYSRIDIYRDKLDELLFNSNLINKLISDANTNHINNLPGILKKLPELRVSILWALFHAFIFILGIILTLLSCKGGSPPQVN